MKFRGRFNFVVLVFSLFLAGGCVPTGTQSGIPRYEKDPASSASVSTEQSGTSVQSEEASTVKPTRFRRAETSAQSGARVRNSTPTVASPQEFKDYTTGLAFTYAQPWYIVTTQWEGPTLGKEGRSYMVVRFTTLTTDRKKAAQPGFLYATGGIIANTFVYALKTLTKPVSSLLGFSDKKSSTPPQLPFDMELTRKHFPSYMIQQRYRGNDGRSIVNVCRHSNLPDPIYVYHVIEGEKIATFSLSDFGDAKLRQEMEKIVYSTHLQ